LIESAEKTTVWEKTEEGYGMRRKYAIEERFSYKKDIRGCVLPFVRLLVYYRIRFLFIRSSGLRQSHSCSHTISFFFLVL